MERCLQEHAKKSRTNVRRSSADYASHHTNEHQQNNMYSAIVCLSRCPCHKKGHQEGSDPDRCSYQQRLDISIAECLDNGREEVLEVLREERRMLEKNEEVDPLIRKHEIKCFFDVG